jgi:hypothetical protein
VNGSARYIVTVDRDRIDRKRSNAIRIEDTRSGSVQNVTRAALSGNVVILEGLPRQDGARVWIECDQVAI